MIDYPRSSFTWHSHPWELDPHYRWPGGFVGEHGQAYHVRFTLQASAEVTHPDGRSVELFLGAPCRSEYTIAARNLFQVPSGEWRMAFSPTHKVDIAPSLDDARDTSAVSLTEAFADHTIDIRRFAEPTEHHDAGSVVEATLANRTLNAVSAYDDPETGCRITLRYPVNVMNLNVPDAEWQVCTGPILVPDPTAWQADQVTRGWLAHVAISAFDHVELIFRRPVEVSPDTAAWLDTPVGRDRQELLDPDNPPDGYPSPRPRPYAYRDVREYPAENYVVSAP